MITMTYRYPLHIILSFIFLPVYGQRVEFTIDAGGDGDFRTIQEAVYAVRDFKPGEPARIFIRNGTYNEKLVVPAYKCNMILEGESTEGVVISCNDYASLNDMGTFRTFTMFIGGNDIEVRNLTVANTAGRVGQAVALHIEGDRVVLRNCRIIGNQDTVFLGREGARQTFLDCYIEGTTDFIFGPSTAWFEGCTIHCKSNSYITAASTPRNIDHGLIFKNCRITAAEEVTSLYLGRPWRAYGMTLFMECELPAAINPAGWHNWSNPDNEQTARYAEFRNYGPGADTTRRVAWSRQLTEREAAAYAVTRDTSYTVYQTYEKERKARPYIEPVCPELPEGVLAFEGLVYSVITERPVGIRELQLDIFRPDDGRTLPAVLMVYGGGWNSGDRTMQVPLAQRLAARGYVTIPVEYRLIPDALYPAAVYDLKDAVRWVRENAEQYGIDTARIAISGSSAGGQLANLVGTTNGDSGNEYIRRYFHVTSDVQAVIDIDGISDFTTPETIGRAQEARDRNLTPPVDMHWLGGTYAERPDTWRAASPVYHVGPLSAPVCFINSSIERFHDGRDEQIALMDHYGIYSEVHTFDDTPHTFWLFHPWFDETVEIMDGFLKKVLE